MTNALSEQIDFAALRRRSRSAATGTIVGAAMIFCAFGYGFFRLNALRAEIAVAEDRKAELENGFNELTSRLDTVRKETEQLIAAKAELEAGVAELTTSVDKLRRDRANLKEFVDEKIQLGQLPESDVDLATCAEVGIRPRVRATRDGSFESGLPRFRFDLWVEFRSQAYEKRLRENIKSLEYKFLHSSFGTDNTKASEDGSDGFAVHYDGYGTVPVDIAVNFKSAPPAVIHLNMQSALSNAEDDEKGTRVRRSPNSSDTSPNQSLKIDDKPPLKSEKSPEIK